MSQINDGDNVTTTKTSAISREKNKNYSSRFRNDKNYTLSVICQYSKSKWKKKIFGALDSYILNALP